MDFNPEELHRDAIAIINDGPQAALWNNDSYDGMVGQLVTSKPNVDGGFLPEFDLSWSTSVKMLDASGALISRFFGDMLPVEGNELTIPATLPPGIAYRIDRISRDPFNVMVQFDLMNSNKH